MAIYKFASMLVDPLEMERRGEGIGREGGSSENVLGMRSCQNTDEYCNSREFCCRSSSSSSSFSYDFILLRNPQFISRMLEDRPLPMFKGNLTRDFTYIDDVVDGILAGEAFDSSAFKFMLRASFFSSNIAMSLSSSLPMRIFNLGGHVEVDLYTLVDTLQKVIFCPMYFTSIGFTILKHFFVFSLTPSPFLTLSLSLSLPSFSLGFSLFHLSLSKSSFHFIGPYTYLSTFY